MSAGGCTLSGPFFNSNPASVARDNLADAAEQMARESEERVLAVLSNELKHPTGYYESRVTTDRIMSTAYEIHDSDVIYGPWLEGTGSRNAETRFKGYAAFRRAAQAMENRAVDIVQNAAQQIVKELS